MRGHFRYSWQDAGAISAKSRTTPRTTTTPDAIPHSTRLLYPRNSGRNDNLRDPLYMYPSLLVSIKGGGGLPLRGSVGSLGVTSLTEHVLASSPNIATRHAQLLL